MEIAKETHLRKQLKKIAELDVQSALIEAYNDLGLMEHERASAQTAAYQWSQSAGRYANLLRETLDYIDAYRKQVDAINGISGADDLHRRITDSIAEVQSGS